MLLNNGTEIRLNSNGSVLPLDVTMVLYELVNKCNWQVYDDTF